MPAGLAYQALLIPISGTGETSLTLMNVGGFLRAYRDPTLRHQALHASNVPAAHRGSHQRAGRRPASLRGVGGGVGGGSSWCLTHARSWALSMTDLGTSLIAVMLACHSGTIEQGLLGNIDYLAGIAAAAIAPSRTVSRRASRAPHC